MRAIRSELAWSLGGVVVSLPVFAFIIRTDSPPRQLGMLWLIASLILGVVVPFQRLMSLVVYAGMATGVALHLGEATVRLDLLLLPMALSAAIAQGHLHRTFHALQRRAPLLLAGWIVIEAASSLASSVNTAASLWVVCWHVSNLLIVGLLCAAFEDDRKGLEKVGLRAALLVAASGLATWAWAAVTHHDNWGANTISGFGIRAHGLAYEPNILAATAIMWMMILITDQQPVRARQWIRIALLLAVVPLTSSRAPILALVVGLAVYVLSRPGIIGRVLPLALFGALGVAGISAFAPSAFAPIFAKLSAFSFQDQTAQYRYNSWHLALADLHDSSGWAWGMGANSFQQRHLDPTRPGENIGYYLGNLPLQMLYDTGIVGCLLLGGAGLALVHAGHLSRRLALMATFTAIALATSPFAFSSWWLFIALALIAHAEPEPIEAPRQRVRRLI